MATLKVVAAEWTGDAAKIVRGLRAFNEPHIGRSRYRGLTVTAREGGRIVGGLVGSTQWTWLHVSVMWVDARARGTGLGARLMAAAMKEAWRRGCRRVYLDTFDFQAEGFYRKLGFRRFGVLSGFPPGHRRIFLWRELTRPKVSRRSRKATGSASRRAGAREHG